MQKIKLKFGGTLLVEDYEYSNGLREEEDKIKIFDSDGKYLDYWEIETIKDIAEVEDLTPKEVWRRICKKIECCKNIENLLDFLGISYSKISKSWKDMMPVLDKEYFNSDIVWTEEKVKDNEWVNRIGDYYIALCEY